ncbi:MAG: thiamine pyrophosphate-dependent enzyme, partial [Dehalococcoidales bacterium]|nr:thiamine pyrophosphate-dependent enzyme [Dehalococcoidales bacterium]
TEVRDEGEQAGYLASTQSAVIDREASPAAIEKAVRLLLEAKHPIVIGGNGVWWAQATEEFKEFVELLQIPVGTREMARGAVAEDHPLAFRGRYAGPLMANADVVAMFGLLMTGLEANGQPPLYKHKGVKYIMVSEGTEDLDARMPTEIRILASPKRVLRQMIDCAKDIMKGPPDRSEWLGTLTRYKTNYQKQQRAEAEKVCDAKPINPHWLAQVAADFLDDDATIIIDSFMFGGFMPNRYTAKFAGHVLDAGMIIGVGHSVGMGLGVQLARPGKQVLGLLGDGGFGITGADLETAARYKLPAVWLLYNNSGWMNTTMQSPDYNYRLSLHIKDSFGMLKDIRYDRIVEEMGCHGEFVTEPTEIRPALERAFNSGKPALINVIPDDRVVPPFLIQGRLRQPTPPPPRPTRA